MSTTFNAASPTAHLLDELALYGITSFDGERDYRPLPDAELVEMQIGSLMNSMADIFLGSRLEGEAKELLWSVVNGFHRRISHTQKRLDDNEAAQKTSVREQDGSEIKSGELEQFIDEGRSLTEARNAFEAMRDWAAEHFASITGSQWLPRSGSRTSHAAMTASAIESSRYMKAKRYLENTTDCPEGTRIVFSGGTDYQDIDAIWNTLDKAKAKYPDMVLLHGGSRKGAELIAAKWASNRKVHQIRFTPDFNLGRKAAFVRNDKMLAEAPQGVIVAPGGGIQEQIAREAKNLGITVMRIGA